MVKKVIRNLFSSKISGPDCISVVVYYWKVLLVVPVFKDYLYYKIIFCVKVAVDV